jgi:DNA polymerase-1
MSFVSSLGPTLAALGWRRAWAIDFEFVPRRGSLPAVVTCMAAHCIVTGEKRSLWLCDEWAPCPFDMADDELFIAHSVTAETSCFIALGWPLPTRVLDTMVETARLWNGKVVLQPGDKDSILEPSLLKSLAYFNIPCRAAGQKDSAIDLVLRGGSYTQQEIDSTLAYCMDDVEDAARLAAALFLASDLADPLRCRQAVWRGRCVAALTAVEATGTPLDMRLVKRLLTHWQAVADGLVDTLGAAYPGVYREDRSLDKRGLSHYLVQRGIPWARTPKTGMPILDEKVREEQVRLFPEMKTSPIF